MYKGSVLEMAQNKKVACFYRVSTFKQLDEDDIPMQKEACAKLIQQHEDWLLVDEYIEKGISGYKVKTSERDELQRVIIHAKEGKFDILVLFASDRLCRREDEYTPILKELSSYVTVFSYTQGDITIRNHTDELKASIDGMQNERESIKMSLRTDEKHKQMTENGEFRGGIAPYGYSLELSGKYNKRDKNQRKELYDLIIDKEEAKAVKEIFNLAYECGYGGNRIAKYLNNNNIKSRYDHPWSMSTVNYLLRNPVYKGYPAYGKRANKKESQINQPESEWTVSKERIDSLAIIPEEIWDKVSLMRKQRNHNQNVSKFVNVPTKGKLLFVGYIFCGHCGSPMTTTHHNKSWVNKDGTVQFRSNIKYRCSGHQSNRVECSGNAIYSRDKIEIPILQYIEDYLSQLEQLNDTNEQENKIKKQAQRMKKELEAINKDKEKKYKEISVLQDEIPKTILGESPFAKEQLSSLINKRKLEIDDMRQRAIELEQKVKLKETETAEIILAKKYAVSWKDEFYSSPIEKQKMMLSSIIDNIKIYQDHFEVNVKLCIQQFVSSVLEMSNDTTIERV